MNKELIEASMWYIQPLHHMAIIPHIILFNIVKSEYSRDSKIHKEGSFSIYYLKSRYDYVHMAKDCIKYNKLLRDCNIIPSKKGINSHVRGHPFWFPIQHTKNDGTRMNEEEVSIAFWKDFVHNGVSLNILNMNFKRIAFEINKEIRIECNYGKNIECSDEDIANACKKICNNKNTGWFGFVWHYYNS